ncbi:MAG TPA: glycosyltransferase family 39 protein [Chthoniobacteraceae bacterium]|jgi:hypothetical protein
MTRLPTLEAAAISIDKPGLRIDFLGLATPPMGDSRLPSPVSAAEISPSSSTRRPAPPSQLPKWLLWAVLALAVVTSVGIRLRLRDFPLERDEGEYAYAGQLILEGIPPYKLAYNMKMPGTYVGYAALMAVFGQTPAGIHIGLIVVQLATLALLFVLARRFVGESGAVIATAAYALMTLSPSYLGLAAHATHFVVLPALAGFLVLLWKEEHSSPWACLASGCLFGIAFLMKQPGVVFGMFGGLYLVYLQLRSRPFPKNLAVARIACFAGGCILPFLAVCFWMACAGVFGNFWYWTISYARAYEAVLPFSVGLETFQHSFQPMVAAAPFLWALAAFGLVVVCFEAGSANRRLFLLGFLVFSFLGVCPGLYFRNHYFIVLLPALTLLMGAGVSWAEKRLAETQDGAQARFLPFILATLACALSLYPNRKVFFWDSPNEACQQIYGGNPFVESLEIARYLEEHTTKSDTIAVIGSEPQIYFYSHRHSATGQIYTYPLMEAQPFAREMQDKMINEIERSKPKYYVLVQTPLSWLAGPNSDQHIVEWAGEEMKKNAVLDGLMQLTLAKNPEGVWGPEAGNAPLRSRYFVAIYKRKD